MLIEEDEPDAVTIESNHTIQIDASCRARKWMSAIWIILTILSRMSLLVRWCAPHLTGHLAGGLSTEADKLPRGKFRPSAGGFRRPLNATMHYIIVRDAAETRAVKRIGHTLKTIPRPADRPLKRPGNHLADTIAGVGNYGCRETRMCQLSRNCLFHRFRRNRTAAESARRQFHPLLVVKLCRCMCACRW